MITNPASWYVPGEGKKPAGPFTAEQIVESWRAGRLNEKTLCWQEGMAKWLPLTQVEPFAATIRLPPPNHIRAASFAGWRSVSSSSFYLLLQVGHSTSTGMSGLRLPRSTRLSPPRTTKGPWRLSDYSATRPISTVVRHRICPHWRLPGSLRRRPTPGTLSNTHEEA